MAVTQNSNPVFPVAAPFNTTPPYSGTFIPAVWSAKLNAKFYKASVYGEIANTDWQGEISNQGDKVYIHTAPSITVRDYTAGSNLTYEAPTPDMQELVIDKGKYFAFQVNDVLAYQAQPQLMEMFSNDAAEAMRVKIDSTVMYNTFTGAAAANKGGSAGVSSGAYNLGTDTSPIALTKDNVLQKILEMASVLDEQNVPSDGRWLVIDPFTRALLMQSPLSQAYITGDSQSIFRNGKIGNIDRFTVYVSNNLPRGAAGTGASAAWVSGDGAENSIQPAGTLAKRRALMAGHRSAITFASQLTKMEPVRNPNDFGDYIRSLNVFGFKVVKPEALTLAIVA